MLPFMIDSYKMLSKKALQIISRTTVNKYFWNSAKLIKGACYLIPFLFCMFPHLQIVWVVDVLGIFLPLRLCSCLLNGASNYHCSLDQIIIMIVNRYWAHVLCTLMNISHASSCVILTNILWGRYFTDEKTETWRSYKSHECQRWRGDSEPQLPDSRGPLTHSRVCAP